MKKAEEWFKEMFGKIQGLKVMMIDPEFAEKMASTNTHNRPLRELRLKNYAHLMALGKWVLQGDCIMYSDEAILMNGQHRLWALASLSQTHPDLKIPFIVQWGVSKRQNGNLTMEAIDRGSPRKASENWWLAEGYRQGKTKRDASRLGSIINIFGELFSFFTRRILEAQEISMIRKLYEVEIKTVMENDQDIKKISRASVLAAFVFAFAGTRSNSNAQRKIMEFQSRLYLGQDISIGNPILTLRNRLLGANYKESKSRTSLFKEVLVAIRAFLEDEKLQKLYTTDRGFDYFLEPQKEIIEKIRRTITFEDLPEKVKIAIKESRS